MNKENQDLINAFNQSKIGRVLNGKEAFRNKVGCFMHGLSYTHPKLMGAIGVASFIGASIAMGPVGSIITAPLLMGGVYTGITPKKVEKADCDFLMNLAVRKASSFNDFLSKQNINESVRISAVQDYLGQNAPKFGYFKDYLKEFPNPAEQIIKSGSKGELPTFHSKDLYVAEALQEIFTKNKEKGGILRGFTKTFTPAYWKKRKKAMEIAEERFADRQDWLKQPESTRQPWRSFMKQKEFERHQQEKKSSSHTPDNGKIYKGLSAILKSASYATSKLAKQATRLIPTIQKSPLPHTQLPTPKQFDTLLAAKRFGTGR